MEYSIADCILCSCGNTDMVGAVWLLKGVRSGFGSLSRPSLSRFRFRILAYVWSGQRHTPALHNSCDGKFHVVTTLGAIDQTEIIKPKRLIYYAPERHDDLGWSLRAPVCEAQPMMTCGAIQTLTLQVHFISSLFLPVKFTSSARQNEHSIPCT